MTFLIVLICTIAGVMVLKKPIKRFPVLFYGLAVALVVVFILNVYLSFPRAISSALLLLIQKCTLSLALFTVVMFIGCFSKDSKVTMWLRPIRAELSIIAWMLSLGHMVMYLMSYLPRVLSSSSNLDVNVLLSFIIAIILFVLLLILGVTSFNLVKRSMKTPTWKRVQMLAYPFFILVYVHLLLMLLPAALLGGLAAQTSIAVYSVIFVGYIVLRSYRALKDRSLAREDAASR